MVVLGPFSLVCKHWYDVACAVGIDQELFVANSKQAGRLATALLHSPAEKKGAIQWLVVHVEKGSKTKRKASRNGQHIADLLLSCPNLKRLTLTIAESLVPPESVWAPFGKALAVALETLDTLEGFELSGPAGPSMDVSVMCP